MKNTRYATLTTGLIAVWFTFSLLASARHWFTADPNRPPLAILLAVLTPIGLFLLWYAISKPFRDFTLSLDPRTLTMVQSWRIAGFAFLVLYTYSILPGTFALPAGWGDMAIGVTALFVAAKLANPNHRRSFIAWQVLGIADLVVAVSSGAGTQFLNPAQITPANAITTAPMGMLPLSLIPTFAVPLFLILHIICIAQARRWPGLHSAGVGEHASSLAVS